uniref:Mannosyltransferase n=2 Tax=Glycine subgen. Soja TaxID=1462606 RepID=K7MK99_SOYBN
TYFNPDEHWQGPEVAHRIAFGYGHLTWEWKQGIPSYLHPFIFVPLYSLLALLHLDTPWLMMRAPRLLQSVFSAVGDLYLYKLSAVLFGYSVAKWTLETVLTLVSLYFWPCVRPSSNCSFQWLVLIRPTSAITWLCVCLLELFQAHNRFRFIFLEVAPIGILVLGLNCLLDCFMYGTWILVPLNFLKFNFLSVGGDYYGTHNHDLSHLPFCIAGIIYSKQWKFHGLLAWVLGFYSLLGHKEFRFVLPVLPIVLMFSVYSLAMIEDPGYAQYKGNKSSKKHTRFPPKMGAAILFLLATNIRMALYMSLVHRRGPEDVMNHLAREALHGKVKSILFLMPCHATPYYSMLHHNLPMQFLDCTPSEEKGVPDESDRFLMDPVTFVSEYAKNKSLPSHVVLFDSEEQKLRNLLISFDYREEKRFFNAHFKVDRDLAYTCE